MPILNNIPAGNLDISDQIIHRINQLCQETSLESLRNYSVHTDNDLRFVGPRPYYKLIELISDRYCYKKPARFKLILHIKPEEKRIIINYWDDKHIEDFSHKLKYIAQVYIGNFEQQNAWTYKLKRGGHKVDLFLFHE